jgi:murein DD-endopeptidase MepM/ murein hydrolase activator NlpD
MTGQQAYDLTQKCAGIFDVKALRVGQTYRAYCALDSSLKCLVYDRDKSGCIVFDCSEPYGVWTYEKPVEIEKRYADVTINSSLWNDMLKAGVSPLLIISLSDIYAWTIDFFALQQGDSIRVHYDEQYVDSTRIGIGQIYACHFYHGGKWQQAYWIDWQDSISNSICRGYFDEEGKSLRKAFLKAPLNYKRVSSHFTYARKHPVYKIVRPHTGVDYAAPAGTPVVTIGDGTVVEKRYKGQAGNMVKIRHNSTYSTAYLHLSKFGNIAVGQRVTQGQVIGYVGSTGASTGPHLDFRVWKNGTPIDPLKMESPPVEPIPSEYKAQFDSIVAIEKTKL